jgi:hypothetical protein
MALKPINSGTKPLGQFDGLDAEVTTFLGGEVCTLTGVTTAATGGTDLAAFDVQDGYSGTVAQTRPAVTKTLSSGDRPLFLADDGTSGYGTLFGTVVGGTVGQSTAGAVLGPHTATGSGKITLWDEPGTYAVTLDAVDTTTGTGLVANNATLAVGDPLYATAAGLLTPNVGVDFGDTLVVARFIEFGTNGSLVNTPNNLVSALNSPSGALGSPSLLAFAHALIHWNPETS